MPSYFPEGDAPLASDTEWRSLQKWCSLLYASLGDRGPAYFPEGSEPQAGDNNQRLLVKINALLE